MYVAGAVLEQLCLFALQDAPGIRDVVGVVVDAPVAAADPLVRRGQVGAQVGAWLKAALGNVQTAAHGLTPQQQRRRVLYASGGPLRPFVRLRVAVDPDNDRLRQDLARAEAQVQQTVLALSGIEVAQLDLIVAELAGQPRLTRRRQRASSRAFWAQVARAVKPSGPLAPPLAPAQAAQAGWIAAAVDGVEGVYERVPVGPGQRQQPTGVALRVEGDEVTVRLHLAAQFGEGLPQLARRIRQAVGAQGATRADLQVVRVDVAVMDLRFTMPDADQG